MQSSSELFDIVILLTSAVLVGSLFRWLRLSPVLGHLAAGAIIGPFGLAVIGDMGKTRDIAELGVVFLLFIIGLELSVKKLAAMRGVIFGLGTLQVALTSAAIGSICLALGLKAEAAVIIGGALALSSTAVVMEVLHDRREESTQGGRISMAILLMQDLLVVPMLVLLPTLTKGGQSALVSAGIAVAKGIVGMTLVFIVGWLIIRPLYKAVALTYSRELFSALTLLIVLGSAWSTEHFGLSMALGAFIAGLLVAETEYQHQVMAEIMPFKGLLLGLFFMVVGTTVDMHYIVENLLKIVGLTALLITVKAAAVFVSCSIFGFRRSTSLHTALTLAQGGEFAFVLFTLAGSLKLLDTNTSQTLLVIVTISMALTPLLEYMGAKWARALWRRGDSTQQNLLSESADLMNHVVIIGFGRVGQTLAGFFTAENINYIALDLDPRTVSDARSRGLPVLYGDACKREMTDNLALDRASGVVLSLDDIKVAVMIIELYKKSHPALPIIARARDEQHAAELIKAGAKVVVPETFESSLQIGAAMLEEIGLPDVEISRIVHAFRAGNYALIHSAIHSGGEGKE